MKPPGDVFFQVRDGTIFMSAVIDANAFERIKSYIDYAKSKRSNGYSIVFGGKCDDSKGYFIEPTCIEVTDFNSKLLKQVTLILFCFNNSSCS